MFLQLFPGSLGKEVERDKGIGSFFSGWFFRKKKFSKGMDTHLPFYQDTVALGFGFLLLLVFLRIYFSSSFPHLYYKTCVFGIFNQGASFGH